MAMFTPLRLPLAIAALEATVHILHVVAALSLIGLTNQFEWLKGKTNQGWF